MRRSFTRRAMLRGLGVTMALPWMESTQVWADDSESQRANQPPVRMAILFSGCGFHSNEWWAKGNGPEMELGKVLADAIEPSLAGQAAELPANIPGLDNLVRHIREKL